MTTETVQYTPVTGSVIDARSTTLHGFLNVVRDLVRQSGIYAGEQDVLDALGAVDKFARHSLGADFSRVRTEDETAPVEDVRLRIPLGGVPVARYNGPPIDYAQLAAAIVAAQQAQRDAGQVHVVTDAVPGTAPSAVSEPLF